jgi:hypothetical protein
MLFYHYLIYFNYLNLAEPHATYPTKILRFFWGFWYVVRHKAHSELVSTIFSSFSPFSGNLDRPDQIGRLSSRHVAATVRLLRRAARVSPRPVLPAVGRTGLPCAPRPANQSGGALVQRPKSTRNKWTWLERTMSHQSSGFVGFPRNPNPAPASSI